jgi:tRNA pseudouridine65 synthase
MPTPTGSAPIEVLYRDDDLVAVHKPAGMLVHRTALDAGESLFLLQVLRDQIGRPVHPAHRLDKGTSGVMVFALHGEAARRLAAAFRDEQVDKTYQAVVRGWAPDRCDVDHALRDIADRYDRRQTVESRPARTEVACVARVELAAAVGRYPTARYSLVECRPRTGRKHQIRRHLKHLRHPVIGDANYGDGAHNRFFRHSLGITRLLLAATAIRLPHPRTGEPVEIVAPPDDFFRAALASPDWCPVGA